MGEMPDDARSVNEAAALVAQLVLAHGPKALGRAQMRLYAAVSERDAEKVHVLTRVCQILAQERLSQTSA